MLESITNYTTKAGLYILNSALHHLECKLANGNDQSLSYPPLFIIGAPRSGSTLLYQVMAEYYDFGYLSNLHCTFYGCPSLIQRFIGAQRWQKPSKYASTHGLTEGRSAPSECGAFWYRFFRRKPQYVALHEADQQKMIQLRSAIRALGDAFKKPILFKNLLCSLRLEPIASALPEALFIIIRRNEVDNAHSLLEGRKKIYGNYTQWWSAEPPAVEQLKQLLPHEQVVEQIYHIYALIDKQRQVIGPEKFIEIQYEAFCDDVVGALRRVDQFLADHNLFPNTDPNKVPTHFERRNEIRIDSELYEKMVAYTANKKMSYQMIESVL